MSSADPNHAPASLRGPFRRVLLKLSGEALMGEQGFGISADRLAYLASELRGVADLRVEIGVVLGGGNIFRGVSQSAQHMGPGAGRPHRHAWPRS